MFTWWEICYEVLLKFLPKMLPGETLCKSAQIFPPKVLVYITKLFRYILFINENLNKQINALWYLSETQ